MTAAKVTTQKLWAQFEAAYTRVDSLAEVDAPDPAPEGYIRDMLPGVVYRFGLYRAAVRYSRLDDEQGAYDKLRSVLPVDISPRGAACPGSGVEILILRPGESLEDTLSQQGYLGASWGRWALANGHQPDSRP